MHIIVVSFSHPPRDAAYEHQNEVLERNHEEFLERQRRQHEELRAETVRTDWCYGPQKLNYVELKKASWHRTRGNETSVGLVVASWPRKPMSSQRGRRFAFNISSESTDPTDSLCSKNFH